MAAATASLVRGVRGIRRIVVFDTETTGLPTTFSIPTTLQQCERHFKTCRIVEMAWNVYEPDGTLVSKACHLVRPDASYTIPEASTKIHGISHAEAMDKGIPIADVMRSFLEDVMVESSSEAAQGGRTVLVAHNIKFDIKVVAAELIRLGWMEQRDRLFHEEDIKLSCTMHKACRAFQLGKYPKLSEICERLFGPDYMMDGSSPMQLHRADTDVELCARVYFELQKYAAAAAATHKK
jgi:DNA polymerase III epsilon subunit-like protein